MALTREQTIELGYTIDNRRRALLDELQDDADQTEVARELDELRAIDAARERIAKGRYGVCAACGNEIDYARLRATPAAIRCIGCQRWHEKSHFSPGRSSL